jgi:hypothetical protein
MNATHGEVEQVDQTDQKEGYPDIGHPQNNAPEGFLSAHRLGSKPLLLKIAASRSLATAPWEARSLAACSTSRTPNPPLFKGGHFLMSPRDRFRMSLDTPVDYGDGPSHRA